MTTWYPDTCGCVLTYEGDVIYRETVVRCPAHVSLVGPPLFNTVLEENQRKNQALAIAQGVSPAIRAEDYQWSFDAQRRLRVGFRGLAPGPRAAVQAALDTKLGPGLATVT